MNLGDEAFNEKETHRSYGIQITCVNIIAEIKADINEFELIF